eukprot:354410-Chlamydomonas_euryale.AAC.4
MHLPHTFVPSKHALAAHLDSDHVFGVCVMHVRLDTSTAAEKLLAHDRLPPLERRAASRQHNRQLCSRCEVCEYGGGDVCVGGGVHV